MSSLRFMQMISERLLRTFQDIHDVITEEMNKIKNQQQLQQQVSSKIDIENLEDQNRLQSKIGLQAKEAEKQKQPQVNEMNDDNSPRKNQKKGKKTTGVMKPKKPLNSFRLFLLDLKQQIGNKQDVQSQNQVTKVGTKKWQTMSLQQKKFYLDRQQRQLQEYDKKLQEYYISNPLERTKDKQKNDIKQEKKKQKLQQKRDQKEKIKEKQKGKSKQQDKYFQRFKQDDENKQAQKDMVKKQSYKQRQRSDENNETHKSITKKQSWRQRQRQRQRGKSSHQEKEEENRKAKKQRKVTTPAKTKVKQQAQKKSEAKIQHIKVESINPHKQVFINSQNYNLSFQSRNSLDDIENIKINNLDIPEQRNPFQFIHSYNGKQEVDHYLNLDLDDENSDSLGGDII